MDTFQLTTLAVFAAAYLIGMLVRARRRARAEMRAARLPDAADPARGSAPDVEHDAPG